MENRFGGKVKDFCNVDQFLGRAFDARFNFLPYEPDPCIPPLLTLNSFIKGMIVSSKE